MFRGKPFATMVIDLNGRKITGSLTGVSIEMGDDGTITNAKATDGPTAPLRASLQSGSMHLYEKDGEDEIEFVMALKSPDAAELRFGGQGAPAHADPISMERAR